MQILIFQTFPILQFLVESKHSDLLNNSAGRANLGRFLYCSFLLLLCVSVELLQVLVWQVFSLVFSWVFWFFRFFLPFQLQHKNDPFCLSSSSTYPSQTSISFWSNFSFTLVFYSILLSLVVISFSLFSWLH